MKRLFALSLAAFVLFGCAASGIGAALLRWAAVEPLLWAFLLGGLSTLLILEWFGISRVRLAAAIRDDSQARAEKTYQDQTRGVAFWIKWIVGGS